MVRFLLLSLWILAIGGGSAQKISGQTVYKAHVSDAEGNAVEYATAVLLSGEKQVGGAVANSDGDFSMEAEAGKYRLVAICRKGWYGIIIAGTGCVALGWNDPD